MFYVRVIRAMVIVWRIRRKLSELFCAVFVHNDTHTHEQLLKLTAGLSLGLVYVRLFRFSFLRFPGLV